MAVYQGVRLRSTALPAPRAVERPTRSIDAQALPVRVRPASVLVATILAATMVGLLYLTQTLASAATSVEIERLSAERAALERQLQTQRVTIQSETARALVEEWAAAHGLVELGRSVTVPAP